MDNKLAIEEARREAQHENVKAAIRNEVDAEIAARADRTTAREAAQINEVAGNFRGKAVDEVVETEREIERARAMARVSQVVDYVFFVVYGLFAIRLILALFRARPNNDFVQFINGVTEFLYSPFRGIVPSRGADDVFAVALPIIIALVVYALLHLAVNGALRLIAQRKTTI